MKIPKEAKLLRVFIGEADKWEGRPLYEAIVHLAKKEGMAGATALKGCLGFGAKSHLHTAKLLRLSEDLPMVVELVDAPEKIDQFLVRLEGMIQDGLVTLERVESIFYGTKGEMK